MFETELYCPSDYCFAVDDSVCFSYDHSVDAAWDSFTGCPVVFRGLGYGLDLLLIEPLPQVAVCAYDGAGIHVVIVTSVDESKVMAGSCNQEHVLVYRSLPDRINHLLLSNPFSPAFKQVHGLTDDCQGVFLLVGLVKVPVFRNDGIVNVSFYFRIYHNGVKIAIYIVYLKI